MYKFRARLAAGLALLAVTFSGCSQTAGTAGGANASGTAAANVNQPAANQPGAVAEGGVATQGTTPAGGVTTPATSAGQDAPPRPAVAAGDASNREPGGAARPAPKPQIGPGGNDFFLFTQTRGALGTDAELKDAGVVIELKEGVATLTGTVASDALKQKAARLVAGVAGVKSVNNQLRVGAAAGQKR